MHVWMCACICEFAWTHRNRDYLTQVVGRTSEHFFPYFRKVYVSNCQVFAHRTIAVTSPRTPRSGDVRPTYASGGALHYFFAHPFFARGVTVHGCARGATVH